MSKSARAVLTGPKEIDVLNVHQLAVDLAVISYRENQTRFDDVYNVPDPYVMATLLLCRAGHRISASIKPDGRDADGHPECTSAHDRDAE